MRKETKRGIENEVLLQLCESSLFIITERFEGEYDDELGGPYRIRSDHTPGGFVFPMLYLLATHCVIVVINLKN
jgi:hypothetical protein